MSAEGRVENQKLNQTAALLSFGWVFGFQLDLLEKNLTTLLGFTFTRIAFHVHTKVQGGKLSRVCLFLSYLRHYSVVADHCRVCMLSQLLTRGLLRSSFLRLLFYPLIFSPSALATYLEKLGGYTVYSVRWATFFPVNRVEHQKLNQTTPYGAVWLSFWCSTRPSAGAGN